MKKFLDFVSRVSIINFMFFLIAVSSINLYNNNLAKDTHFFKQKQSSDQIIPSLASQTSHAARGTTGQTQSAAEPTPKARDFFSELSTHNSISSCWIAYGGHVYDITSFFGSHPGGDAIMLKYCGQDATAAFDSKEKSPPVPHSGNAVSLLQQYLVQ